ncbi:MAG TPA: nucleotidyltransferase family protein [Candidatus Limnocylindria bacterium]|nr:nucleotidyltransferase family protein [Candidatus Limnocylindria bacterium]
MRRPAAGLILAAGDGLRFGGNKLSVMLDGRPLLQHVLDLATEAALEPVVVVLGRSAASLEQRLRWRAEQRVLNTEPERGLSSSVAIGLEALAQRVPQPLRAVVLLGDQPRLAVAQLELLLAVPADPARPIVVPRYSDGQPGNPVLLERAAWPLTGELSGDRGVSQLFAARPERVRYVDVPGTNPDIDTPADLAALA